MHFNAFSFFLSSNKVEIRDIQPDNVEAHIPKKISISTF